MKDKIISAKGSTNPEYIRWNNEHENVLKGTRLPITDVNNRTFLVNPFDCISVVTHYEYEGITCIRTNKEDIFFYNQANKLFVDFICEAQKSKSHHFSKDKPWTNIEPFPNSYNKYRKQLKLLIFRIDYYRSYLNLREKNIVVDIFSIINNLGVKYHILEEGVSVGIKFWNCENVPELLPPYFMVYDMNKVDFNFHGSMLEKETLDSIKNYML